MEKAVIFETFESLSDFSRVLNSRKRNSVFKGRRNLGSEYYDYKKQTEIMQTGWEEGHKYLKDDMLKVASCPLPKMKRERSYYGARVHVGALLAGSEQAFIKRRKRLTDTKNILTIYINTAVLGDVYEDEVAEVMARIIDAVISMENNGYSVNLYACCMSQTRKEVGFNVVKIKDSAEQLNLLRLMYPCLNSCFQRAHAFKWRETCPELKDSSWASGYGSTVASVADMKYYARQTPAQFDAILGYYSCMKLDRQQIVDEIIKQAREGVK